ncbi:MAG: hypothetical protein WAO21_01995 [Verrucomicrobiia bacterium]|jgi:hypothetical protein
MISLLITLIIICAVFSVAWYILSIIPFPPPLAWLPNVIKVVLALILLIWLVEVLLPMAGGFHGFVGPCR